MPQYWQLPAVGGGPGAAPVPTGGALVYAERVPAEATAANGRTPGAAQLLQTASQRRFAAVATTATFAGVFALLCAVPAIVLLLTSVADVNFAGLKAATDAAAAADAADADNGRAQCLRVARRADYTIVFLGVGAPVQHLRLLLRVDEVVADPADALYVFSSRLLKSQSIQCDSASAEATLVAHCYDVALVYDGAYEQRHVQTSFQFSNAEVAESRHARAYELRLDGELRLSLGHTVQDDDVPLLGKHGAFPPSRARRTPCCCSRARTTPRPRRTGCRRRWQRRRHDVCRHARRRVSRRGRRYQNELEGVLFPLAAHNEYAEWLVLGAQFTFEYSTDTLADRRTVIEADGVAPRGEQHSPRARGRHLRARLRAAELPVPVPDAARGAVPARR